jgi:methyl-accepting chemotaxis protein
MSSTAEELASQAEQLQDTIAFFRVEDSSGRTKRQITVQHRDTAAAPKTEHKAKVAHITHETPETEKHAGIALDMGSSKDRTDDEFEKY